MAVYSMTGYASGQTGSTAAGTESDARPSAAGRLGLEIRSVNSRFLDLTFKLPEELRQHEAALRELLTGRLKRGKVELRASIESAGTAGIAVTADGKVKAGMGTAFADFNGNGRLGLVVTNHEAEMHSVFLNVDGAVFSDVTVRSGVGPATRP